MVLNPWRDGGVYKSTYYFKIKNVNNDSLATLSTSMQLPTFDKVPEIIAECLKVPTANIKLYKDGQEYSSNKSFEEETGATMSQKPEYAPEINFEFVCLDFKEIVKLQQANGVFKQVFLKYLAATLEEIDKQRP